MFTVNLVLMRFFVILFSVSFYTNILCAQTKISGVVRRTVADSSGSVVSVRNINTKELVQVDSSGEFAIDVKTGHLLEFTCINLETTRVRIANEKGPKYYYIEMKPRVRTLAEITAVAKGKTYAQDSMGTYETYKTVFDKPGRDEYTMGSGIMAGLSKRQREEWVFREKSKWWEEQKYIDSKFGEKPLSKMTGLSGDSLLNFIQVYKPSYYDLRQMSDYKYLLYVKTSLAEYCPACIFVGTQRRK
jgi:hypothetical protein